MLNENKEVMLEVKNIFKNFGDLEVLKGVSTEVDKGEVISIIGASGSGKLKNRLSARSG